MTHGKNDPIRIVVDLGGTKIEFVTLDRDGAELHLVGARSIDS